MSAPGQVVGLLLDLLFVIIQIGNWVTRGDLAFVAGVSPVLLGGGLTLNLASLRRRPWTPTAVVGVMLLFTLLTIGLLGWLDYNWFPGLVG